MTAAHASHPSSSLLFSVCVAVALLAGPARSSFPFSGRGDHFCGAVSSDTAHPGVTPTLRCHGSNAAFALGKSPAAAKVATVVAPDNLFSYVTGAVFNETTPPGLVSIATGGGKTSAMLAGISAPLSKSQADATLGDVVKTTANMFTMCGTNAPLCFANTLFEGFTCSIWRGDPEHLHAVAAGSRTRRVSAGCFGAGGMGVSGGGATGSDVTPAVVGGGWAMLGRGVSGGTGGPPRDVQCATFHCCVVHHAARVTCWGAWQDVAIATAAPAAEAASVIGGPQHPFGDPSALTPLSFAPGIDPLDVRANAVVAVSLTMLSTCTLHADGKVRCFGIGPRGELGRDAGPETVGVATDPLGTPTRRIRLGSIAPLRFATTVAAVEISGGHFHHCAVFAASTSSNNANNVRCWGGNDSGQLGQGHVADVGLNPARNSGPTLASLPFIPFAGGAGAGNGEEALQVACGDNHACAVFASGGVRCWGANGKGQLGYDNTDVVGTGFGPAPAISLLGYVQFANPATHGRMHAVAVTAGGATSCAAFAEGTSSAALALGNPLKVRCWGDGSSHGVSGDGAGTVDYGSTGGGFSIGLAPFIDGYDYTSGGGTGAPLPAVTISPHLGASLGALPVAIHGAPGVVRYIDTLVATDVASGASVTLPARNLTRAVHYALLPAWSAFEALGAAPLDPVRGAVVRLEPAGAGGTVTAAGGSPALNFTYLPVPVVTAVQPTSVPATGGVALTLYGVNFDPHTLDPPLVRLEESPVGLAPGTTPWYAEVEGVLDVALQRIVVASLPDPVRPTGLAVNVSLYANRGYDPLALRVGELSVSDVELQYYSLVISKLQPSVTKSDGGLGAVTISGANWIAGMGSIGAPSVYREFINAAGTVLGDGPWPAAFQDADAAVVWSGIQPAPAAAPAFPYRVSLKVAFGAGPKTTAATFIYSEEPTVLRAVPSFLPVDAQVGVPLTIYGTDFVDSTGIKVRYNMMSGPVYSDGQYKKELNAIVTTTPAGVQGETLDVDIALNGVDFTATNATIRVYAMTSLEPKAVLASGGSRMDIKGSNFLATGNSSVCAFLDIVTQGIAEITHAFYISETLVRCYTPVFATGMSRYPELSLLGGLATTERNEITAYTTTVFNVSDTLVPGRPLASAAGDIIITITGVGFPNLGTLSRCISGPPASPNSATNIVSYYDETKLSCLSPRTSGYHTLHLSMNGFQYEPVHGTVLTHVQVTGVTPGGSPAGRPGVSIRVGGIGFLSLLPHNATVEPQKIGCYFYVTADGSVTKTRVTILSDVEVRCEVPTSAAPKVYYVDLYTGPGFADRTEGKVVYETYNEPQVSAVTPQAGPSGGGTIVTVYGSDFANLTTGDALVRFGISTTVAHVHTSSKVVCILATGSGTVPVEITFNSGYHYSYHQNKDDQVLFSYYSIFSTMPASGPTNLANTTVVVFGTGFFGGAAARCHFGAALVPAEVITESQVRCTAPLSAALATVSLEFSPDGALPTGDGKSFTYYDPPTVTASHPVSGPSLGVKVTLYGSGFVPTPPGDAKCVFGGAVVDAALVTNGTTYMVCDPADGQGDVKIGLSLNRGVNAPLTPFGFTFFTARSAHPVSGRSTGGSLVQLDVVGIVDSPTLRCKFGSVAVPGKLNGGVLECVSPPHANTTVPLTISQDGTVYTGGSGITFTFYNDPAVVSILPDAGSSFGGTVITVRGTGFVPQTGQQIMCRFGILGVPAISHQPDLVVCVSVAGSGAVGVEVSVNSGAEYTSNDVRFTYSEPRLITPTSGPNSGGTQVLVKGTGFVNSAAAKCFFDGTPVAAVFLSSASVLCTVPKNNGFGVPKPFEYSPDGTPVLTPSGITFTYYLNPTVTDIKPNIAPAHGGINITLSGDDYSLMPLENVYCGFGVVKMRAIDVISGVDAVSNLTVVSGYICPSPKGPLGIVPIGISFNNGETMAVSPTLGYADYSFIEASPTLGPSAGGTTVTLLGTGFLDPARIAIVDQRCRFLTPLSHLEVPAVYVSPELLTCVTPPSFGLFNGLALSIVITQGLGLYTIPVAGTATGGVANVTTTAFTYLPPPTVTSYTSTGPSRVVSGGGSTSVMTISGEGFVYEQGPQSYCVFRTNPSTPTELIRQPGVYTDITCGIPEGTGTVDVDITFNGGANYVSVGKFTFHTVTQIVPDIGPETGGTTMELRGTGFKLSPGLKCRMAGVVSAAVFVSESLVTCVTPPGFGAREVELAVENDNYGGGHDFTYHPPLTVVTHDPKRSISSGNIMVTVTGTNFVAGREAYCLFGSAVAVNGTPPAISVGKALTDTTVECPTAAHPVGFASVSVSHSRQQFVQGTEAMEFHVCDPGTFSVFYYEPCTPCAPGTFTNRNGTEACFSCDVISYAPDFGSTNCTSCPANTEIVVDERDARELCLCRPGFYEPDGLAGRDCLPCPNGALCEGQRALPVAKPGYWADRSSPVLFMKCDVPEACVGGPPASCATGATGKICQECIDGYYPLYRRCVECPPTAVYRVPFFVFMTLIVAIVIFWSVGRNSLSTGGTFSVTVAFFQIIAFIGKLQLGWPANFLTLVQVVTVPFTFELDVLATECAYTSSYPLKWTFMFFFPVLFLVHFALIYVSLLAYLTLKGTNYSRLPGVVGTPVATHSAAVQQLPAGDSLATEYDVRNRSINGYLFFLKLIYLMPTILSFEIWDCTLREDGRWHLDAAPALYCFEEWWSGLAPFGAAGMVLYGVLIPFGIGLFIRRNRARLHTPQFLVRYSSLYADYKDTVPYWETVVMLLKFSMLLPIMFFTVYEDFQVNSFLLVLFVSLVVQMLWRPFFVERYNRLQLVVQWFAVAILVVGMGIRASLAQEDKFFDKELWAMSGLAIFLVAVAIMSVLSFILFDITVIKAQLIRKVEPDLLNSVDLLMHQHGKAEIAQWLGRGGNGRRYAAMFNDVLSSIAVDVRSLRVDPTAVIDPIALDRFVNLYTGICFSPAVVPVVRDWLVRRIDTGDPYSLYDVWQFQKTFAQFCKFQRRLRANRSFALPLIPPMHIEDVEAFRELIVDQEKRPLEPVRNMIRALYQDNVVSDSIIVAVMMQLYIGDNTSLRSMNKAFIGLALAKAREDAERAEKRGNLQDDTLHQAVTIDVPGDDGNGGLADLFDDSDDDFDDGDGDGDGDGGGDPNGRRHNMPLRRRAALLLPYLNGFYEGAWTDATLTRIARWIEDDTRVDTLRSQRKTALSPFFYLHHLFCCTREDVISDDGQVFREQGDTGRSGDAGMWGWFGGDEYEMVDGVRRRVRLPWYHGFSKLFSAAKQTIGLEEEEEEESWEPSSSGDERVVARK